MSLLPFNQFSANTDYLRSIITFLKKYSWIYKRKNTDILTANVVNSVPEEWIQWFKTAPLQTLKMSLMGEINDSAPTELREFIQGLYNLKPLATETIDSDEKLTLEYSYMSTKKISEIQAFAPIIDKICKQNYCDLIVDVGSGLGYLSHVLYESYGYPVLGLEASANYVSQAYKNQQTYHAHTKGHVIFIELFIHEDSYDAIEFLIQKHFPRAKRICITGLHSCADLSVDVLTLFSVIKNVQALAIMPCCYHKLAVHTDKVNVTFIKNFPCSYRLKRLFEEYHCRLFMRIPFLRLASQQTVEGYIRMSESDINKRSYEWLFRALLELVASLQNCTVRRLKRKSGKLDTENADIAFEMYLNNLESTHLLESGWTSKRQYLDDVFLTKMREKWKQSKDHCHAVKVLAWLQAALQSLCEHIILIDRVEFLREKGYYCYMLKTINDYLSPRCWAVVATKP